MPGRSGENAELLKWPSSVNTLRAEITAGEGTGPISFSAVEKGIVVGIIHSAYPNQLIDNEHLGLLQRVIMKVVKKIPEEVDRQIGSADQESHDWLKTTVEGAALRTVEVVEMPKPPFVCHSFPMM
ncbi:hypothetical protein JTB14_018991 [Gonioctena quinquepunctata]|nr:hypothetical protein JTB14_018991 [Gonioctena quinquepunctata]